MVEMPSKFKKSLFIIVVFCLICFVAGYLFGTVVNAFGEPVSAPNSSVQQRACVTHDQKPCPPPAKWAVSKFKHGKMGHARGFNPNRFFVHPKAARKIIIRKLDHAMKRQHVSRRYAGKTMTAAAVYDRLVKSASCVGHGSYQPYSYGADLCNMVGPNNKISSDDLKAMGTMTFCLGGTGLGVMLAPETGTASVWLMAGFGTASCTWGAWLAFGS